MTSEPEFPPLLRGRRVAAGGAFDAALATAGEAEPGTVFWSDREDVMEAALLLAPDCALERAMTMLPTAQLALIDALGAIGPPELPLQVRWPDGFIANGAQAGAFRVAASTQSPEAEPDWLIIGVKLRLADAAHDPGQDQARTALWLEGAGDLTALQLVEAWARHALRWIHHWGEDGFGPIHAAIIGRIEGVRQGDFIGLDEHGGALMRDGETTRLRPLTDVLGAPAPWPWERTIA